MHGHTLPNFETIWAKTLFLNKDTPIFPLELHQVADCQWMTLECGTVEETVSQEDTVVEEEVENHVFIDFKPYIMCMMILIISS